MRAHLLHYGHPERQKGAHLKKEQESPNQAQRGQHTSILAARRHPCFLGLVRLPASALLFLPYIRSLVMLGRLPPGGGI